MSMAREYRVFEEVQEVRPGSHQPVVSVREVWYNNLGEVDYVSEPVQVMADFALQLQEEVAAIQVALSKEVLMLSDYMAVVEAW